MASTIQLAIHTETIHTTINTPPISTGFVIRTMELLAVPTVPTTVDAAASL